MLILQIATTCVRTSISAHPADSTNLLRQTFSQARFSCKAPGKYSKGAELAEIDDSRTLGYKGLLVLWPTHLRKNYIKWWLILKFQTLFSDLSSSLCYLLLCPLISTILVFMQHVFIPIHFDYWHGTPKAQQPSWWVSDSLRACCDTRWSSLVLDF